MYKLFSESGSTSAEALSDAGTERFRGSPFSPQSGPKISERCAVHSVYPDRYTCDIFTETGRFLTGVPWPGVDGGVNAPRIGQQMVADFTLGAPRLSLQTADRQTTDDGQTSFTTAPTSDVGGQDPVYADAGTGNARGNLPRDVLPGDWLQVGDLGNMLGVLEGGATIVKASELAQIIATQAQNLLKLVGQNFALYTGAGELRFDTTGGKTSMVLRAGADNETESDPRTAENFRIRLEMGDEGELVDFRVTDGTGRILQRLHIDPDGRVETESKRRTDVINEDRRTEVGENDVRVVGGNVADRVGGTVVQEVSGSVNTLAGGTVRSRAGGDAAMSAGHDVLVNAARNARFSTGGQVVGSDPSMLFTVANGDVSFDVGNPAAGDTQVRQSGFNVDLYTGSFSVSTIAGEIDFVSPIPGSVKLGGISGANGAFSVMIYEFFDIFMEIFGFLLDTHTHLQPALGGVPTTPPTVPIWQSSRAFFELSKSKYIKTGG